MESAPRDTLRIIDANLNRIGEGLRFLEEVARLTLNDAALTQQLKNMRHEMVRCDRGLQTQLMQYRDAAGDIGVEMEVPGEEKGRDMPAAVVANARRVQEALRVMEEIARAPGLGLDTDKFKQARFALYTIEKTLLSRVLRQDKIKHLSGLYVVIDTVALKGRSHIEVARQVIRGGTKVIQLRDKMLSKKEMLPIARELQDLCAEKGVLFIMNDYLDIALAVDADGLHVGQDDLPVKVARRLLPIDKILGCSASTVEEAVAAQSDSADYIAVGAIFSTPSKDVIDVVGLKRIKQIKKVTSLPIVAIGGINEDNLREVLAAGADSVAVISAVLGADDVAGMSRRLVNIIEGEHHG
jgi:thiamine-phosphate pyrophosphorylase